MLPSYPEIIFMNRKEAMELITKKVGNQPIISANGYESRDLFETYDKESNFYMIGSMGLASSIALGVAIKNPNKRIYVFDGDGNILMNLGSITTVGALQQKNYVHIVFDNESHESTGGQPTHTRKIDLKNIAKSVNYTVYKIMTENGLQRILTKIQNIPGPIMIIIKIEENTHVSKRVSLNTINIRDRFMHSLKK